MKLMESTKCKGNGAFSAKVVADAQQKLKDLATRGSDVEGISFAGEALHYVYFQTKFERRGLLIYHILKHLAHAEGPHRTLEKVS
jgi:hypothetical protein